MRRATRPEVKKLTGSAAARRDDGRLTAPGARLRNLLAAQPRRVGFLGGERVAWAARQMSNPALTLRETKHDGSDLASVRSIFWEYLQWANEQNARVFDVRFDIAAMLEDDMRTLHKFAPPAGRIVLAMRDDEALGIGCLRRLHADVAEIKRMYVRPQARGAGLGRRILDALLAHARAAGYARVRLDSAGYMTSAHALYQSAGFRDVAPYAESEIPVDFQKHWVFMERELG